jgi:glycosyltransferase involved in cell wall biosynthesis
MSVDSARLEQAGEILLRAYPALLSHVEGNTLVWRDGSRTSLYHPDAAEPDLLSQLQVPYPYGDQYRFNQAPTSDPGRLRSMDFFKKMYGATQAEVEQNLTEVHWLPKLGNKRLLVTRINGIHRKIEKISGELQRLPRRFRKYFRKIGGTYQWRTIAGSDQPSPHAFGFAIDINVAHGNYWRWDEQRKGKAEFGNQVPREIVDIFERHGFIWGGKWHHYDTMHFEYRPELLCAADSNFGRIHTLYLNREPVPYGAERQMRHLLEGLTDSCFDPITVYAEGNKAEHELPADARIFGLRSWRKWTHWLGRYIDAYRLLGFCRKQQIDLIHCSYQWLVPYAVFVGKRLGVPVIAHVRRPGNSPGKLLSLGYGQCDAVIGISQRIVSELEAIPALKGKVHCIYDAVDMPLFTQLASARKPGKKLVFGMISRVYKSKRQLEFVKVAKRLLDEGIDAEFVLAGRADDAAYAGQINTYLEKHQLQHKIRYLGHCNDVPSLLSSIDVLISLAGGSIMYEAMAAGCLVISAGFTKRNDATHVIDGVTGLVTSSRSPDELAKLMRKAANDQGLRELLGKNAACHAARHFSREHLVKLTQDLYLDCLMK